jgi:hypothetical protein
MTDRHEGDASARLFVSKEAIFWHCSMVMTNGIAITFGSLSGNIIRLIRMANTVPLSLLDGRD